MDEPANSRHNDSRTNEEIQVLADPHNRRDDGRLCALLFVRKNFNTAMPSIEVTFGITKAQLGLFLTLNGIIYGLSRFINGFIADRVSARKVMSLGLALSALVNIGFGFSDKMAMLVAGTAGGQEYITALTIIMGSILLLNGYFKAWEFHPSRPS